MAESAVFQVNIRKRLYFFFGVLIMVAAALICRLAWIQIAQSENLSRMAQEQWNRSIPTRSPRGSIYDCQDRLLAGSITVDTVVAIPPQVKDADLTAGLLAPLLEMDRQKIYDLLIMDRSAIYLKRKVEPEISQRIRDLKLPGITFTPEGRRYYPGGKLASQLLGFVGMDQGWSGLEIYYEEQLKGREGRILFPADAWGRQLPHEVRKFVAPKEGMDLYLTIDETIQYIVERELSRAALQFQPRKVMAIAADPFSGAVLAAASIPDFDPANYDQANPEYWPLSPVTDSFEPGSTFKLVTLSAAIEEGLYNEHEYFFCSGYANVAGHNIGCWTSSQGGHGSITYLQVVEGSCNPGFINLGQRLGKEKLFKYIKAFGYGQKTGIDYPGEGTGIVFPLEQVGPLELATSSFGQGVSVTPLQQVMAVSAIANGGMLMKPYLVKEIRDQEGEQVFKQQPARIRQVVSRQTAEKVSRIMEQVTLAGSGMNAAIEGYRIATKTGTAQKVGPGGTYLPGQYVLSLIGFVPADNPKIVLYVAVDGVTRGPQWGSQVCAPIFKRIMQDVLVYLKIPPQEQSSLSPVATVKVPQLCGLTIDQAAAALDTRGLLLKVVGKGSTIINQTPKAGAEVLPQTRIIVYLSDTGEPSGQIPVPELTGFSVKEAGEVLSWLGLKLAVEGSGVAMEQQPQPGNLVEPGAVIKVTFDIP